VGGDIKPPKIIKMVQPKYPPAARHNQVEGVVVLEATVTNEGTVEKVKVISGPPMLIQAAIDAVEEWRYEPTYVNGEPVAVVLTATINFQKAAAGR
jgi:protein TonB